MEKPSKGSSVYQVYPGKIFEKDLPSGSGRTCKKLFGSSVKTFFGNQPTKSETYLGLWVRVLSTKTRQRWHPANQLRLVVDLIMCKVLAPFKVVVLGFLKINSITSLKINGWNLKITQFEKENHLQTKSPLLDSNFVNFPGSKDKLKRASGCPRLEWGAQLTSLPALRHQQFTTLTIKKIDILQGTGPYLHLGKRRNHLQIYLGWSYMPSQKGLPF